MNDLIPPASWANASPLPLSSTAAKDPGQDRKQLIAKSKEFESILLTQWLQAAEDSFATVPGEASEQDPGSQQMTSYGIQNLAKALSDAGGLGIAPKVYDALTRASQAESHKPIK